MVTGCGSNRGVESYSVAVLSSWSRFVKVEEEVKVKERVDRLCLSTVDSLRLGLLVEIQIRHW